MENAYSIILIEKNDMKFYKYFNYSQVKYISEMLQRSISTLQWCDGIMDNFFFLFSAQFYYIYHKFFWEMFTDFFFKRKGNTSKQVGISVRVPAEDKWHTEVRRKFS